jgi:hypothetical protein
MDSVKARATADRGHEWTDVLAKLQWYSMRGRKPPKGLIAQAKRLGVPVIDE